MSYDIDRKLIYEKATEAFEVEGIEIAAERLLIYQQSTGDILIAHVDAMGWRHIILDREALAAILDSEKT